MGDSEEYKYFDFNSKNINKLKEFKNKKINPKIEIITIYSENNVNFSEKIKSVINQTFPYWKWKIVNVIDEKKLDIIENTNKDDRISILSSSKETVESIINKIVKESQCEYIFMLNQNSILDETILECSYWSLESNPEASWCYANYVVNDKILENSLFFSEEEKRKNIVNSSYLIRKKDVLQIGGYIRQNKESDLDWLLFLKLLKQNKFPIRMNFYGTWNKNYNEKIVTEEILQESSNIKNKLTGINYPVGSDYWFDTAPFELDWKEEIEDTNKINLLFIFPWFRVGGADKFNFDLISNLDRAKYSITILTTEPCPYIWRQKFENYAEIFDLTTFLHRKYWAPFMHYIIKTRNINLVFNSNSYYGYYAIPWLKSKFSNVIFTDYLHAINWNWRNGEYPVDSTAISRILDKTFVTSNQVKNVMEKQMGRKKDNTKIIYIGVDEKKFKEDNPDIKIEKVLSNSEKFNDKKILLFCSRIAREKRPLLMIKILEELKKKREDIFLFVVGDGEELNEMKEKTIELGLSQDVEFFGMQNDVRPFYKLAKLLVNCSIREGITLTTYEALSMSVPVVTADVGGQKELVDDTCGRIVQNIQTVKEGEQDKSYSKEEIQRYVNAIEEVIDNEQYEQMRKNCREKIENKFTITMMVNNIENEFDDLISKGSQVPSEVSNNEELYKNYLVVYNEIDRRYYNSAKGGIIPEPEDTLEQRLRNQISEIDNELEKKKWEVKQKDDEIEQKNMQLQEKENEIKNIYNSKRWRYMEKILKILRK